jgi:hypothetical protein
MTTRITAQRGAKSRARLLSPDRRSSRMMAHSLAPDLLNALLGKPSIFHMSEVAGSAHLGHLYDEDLRRYP